MSLAMMAEVAGEGAEPFPIAGVQDAGSGLTCIDSGLYVEAD
jgi:hypothetical protein